MPAEGTIDQGTTTTEAATTAASAASAAAAIDTSGAAGAGGNTTAADAGTNGAAGETKPLEGETKADASATAPEKYELKLPDGSTFDADFVTRTADIARALGLSNEAGQKLLDAQIAEVTQARTAAVEAAKAEQLAAMQPGGAVWKEQEAVWRGQSLTDAEIGGSPEKLQASVDLAAQVVNRFATDATKKFFQDSGLGSHPELVRVFARIGRQMSESTLVRSSNTSSGARTEDERLAKRYPSMVPKS